MDERILALDQSTVNIGWSVWDGNTLKMHGLFKPDWPRLDKTREFIRAYCDDCLVKKLQPVVVCEDIYYGRNVLTYRQLATLLGHIQAVTYDTGGDFALVKANDALFALTGIRTSPRKPIERKERKRLIIEVASMLAKEMNLQEDVADSIAIAKAYLNAKSAPV